ncbi:hypothetical protein ILYODFUR_038401 [Ilyodon furcidens]|uniref:Uncharacterized protein n=1 Tax=Ilyodon furcidens TaxID=33524 RepID=A0ABV0UBV2_9TELE
MRAQYLHSDKEDSNIIYKRTLWRNESSSSVSLIKDTIMRHNKNLSHKTIKMITMYHIQPYEEKMVGRAIDHKVLGVNSLSSKGNTYPASLYWSAVIFFGKPHQITQELN